MHKTPSSAGTERVPAPLEIMQSAFVSTASKIVILETMRWVQRQGETEESRWHGLLRKGMAKAVTGGRYAVQSCAVCKDLCGLSFA